MLSLAVLLAATTGLASDVGQGIGGGAGSHLFVSPGEARPLLDGGATVLDARESGYFLGHVPRAQPVSWLRFRDGWGRTGRLDPDVAGMARRLAALGVDRDRPVLVYGAAADGFGEEGRIAWMLSYLGHPRVHILDGGLRAWRQSGGSVERGLAGRVPPGSRFVPTVQPPLRADKEAVRGGQASGAIQLLDVRGADEYQGATPYFEARGGHIPGARHLDWRTLLDGEGRLRPAAEVRQRLADSGITAAGDGRPIVVYCTGGVRSAFVWAALRSSGLGDVRNYDGSFWEWAADKRLPVTVSDGGSGPAPR